MRCVAVASGLMLLLASGCPEDRDPTTTASSTSTSTTSGTSTGNDGGSSGVAESSTGFDWPLPTEDDLQTCVETCELPSDCCPPDTQGSCPSALYPYNFACYQGLCIVPPCAGDEDCMGAGEVCREVGGLASCIVPCEDDAPCMESDSTLTCSGVADDGSSYCFAHCNNPGVFCGNTSCDEASGVCVCSSAGQCLSGWDCV